MSVPRENYQNNPRPIVENALKTVKQLLTRGRKEE